MKPEYEELEVFIKVLVTNEMKEYVDKLSKNYKTKKEQDAFKYGWFDCLKESNHHMFKILPLVDTMINSHSGFSVQKAKEELKKLLNND